MNNLKNTEDHALIDIYDLRKDFDSPAGRLEILKGIHYSIKPGTMSFIVGRSGSGKSTLLHVIGGLDMPTSGKILFEGENMTLMKESSLARLRCRRIGFVFQAYHLLPEFTLFENVLLPSLIAGKRDDKWAKELLKRVKLSSRADHYPSELSGGEKQRGAIARALMNRPSVVLCDEPTGNLDSESAEAIYSLLGNLNSSEGQTFIVVTHDEVVAWRHENVHRLVDGVLLPEDRRGVDVHTMP